MWGWSAKTWWKKVLDKLCELGIIEGPDDFDRLEEAVRELVS